MNIACHYSSRTGLLPTMLLAAVLAACGSGAGTPESSASVSSTSPASPVVAETAVAETAVAPVAQATTSSSDSSTSTAKAQPEFPTRGYYRTSGHKTTLTGLKFGLSLFHEDDRTTEIVVATDGDSLENLIELEHGVFHTDRKQVANLQSTLAVYVLNGRVNLLPLDANGSDPRSRIVSSDDIGACGLPLHAPNYEASLDARVIVSKKGPDGICGTNDDTQSKLRFTFDRQMVFEDVDPVLDGKVLGYLFDKKTNLPRAWVMTRKIETFAESPATIKTFFPATSAGWTRVVQQLNDSILVEGPNGLDMVSVTTSGDYQVKAESFNNTWQSAGFDNDNAYIYFNSGQAGSPGTVGAIYVVNRSTGSSTLMSVQFGYLAAVEIGSKSLLVSLLKNSGNSLLQVMKASPYNQTVLRTSPALEGFIPVTGPGSVHAVWRVSTSGTGQISSMEMIDENGRSLKMVADASLVGLTSSRTLNVAVSGQLRSVLYGMPVSGINGLNGKTLAEFNFELGTEVVYGTLPVVGAAEIMAWVLPSSNRTYATGSIYGEGVDWASFTFYPGMENSILFSNKRK